MGLRGALVTGTAITAAVTAAWSYMASLAVGPAPPVHLSRDLPSDYAQLAGAATGSPWELFAVIAAIYALCLLVSGLRGGGT